MKLKSFLAALLCLCFFVTPTFSASLPNNIGNYIISYQPGLTDSMKKFDMAITDVRNYSKDQISQIQAVGTKVVGYVSVGESVVLEKGDGLGPGGYASWYFDSDNNSLPDQNGQFGSYYTNAASNLWTEKLLDTEIKNVIDMGADGIFLDTVNTIEVYPQSKDGMINLIKKIRERFPSVIIVQNWGFNIAESTAQYINAVMWESWYPDSKDQWVINWQNKFRELKSQYGLDLITLGYYENYSNLDRYFEASKELGFIPFVYSNSNMNTLVNYFSARKVIYNSNTTLVPASTVTPITATPTPKPTATPTPTPKPTATPVLTPTPKPTASPTSTPKPATPSPTVASSPISVVCRTDSMQPYKSVGPIMMIGPIVGKGGWSTGWTTVKNYFGMLYREARGWDAGIEFTIKDTRKNAKISVYYLDDKKGTLLGLSYYKWDRINLRPVWSTVGVKKFGLGYVKSYNIIIPKNAFVDNNKTMPGVQVLLGIGGLSPYDAIKSVGFSQ